MTIDEELLEARCDLMELLDELAIPFDPEEETEVLIQRVAAEARRLRKSARKVRP